MFVLDTDICIFLLEGRSKAAAERLAQLTPDDVCTTAVSAAELSYGAFHSQRSRESLSRLNDFIGPMTQLPFDAPSAVRFGELKQYLVAQGNVIGGMDMLIAATVLANDGILVTNNIREFGRVPGLRLENWLSA